MNEEIEKLIDLAKRAPSHMRAWLPSLERQLAPGEYAVFKRAIERQANMLEQQAEACERKRAEVRT